MPSERLAAQVLLAEGFTELDPTHPLGGPDGGKDAVCRKDGLLWVMAVYFPRGQQSVKEVKSKFEVDLGGVRGAGAEAFVFVTNQELTDSERDVLRLLARDTPVVIYHLERLVAVLDQPSFRSVRDQFLGSYDLAQVVNTAVVQATSQLMDVMTGGTTFCYWMLYHFDMSRGVAQQFVVIRSGDYPLYDLRLRVRDLDRGEDLFHRSWGEISAPAEFLSCSWTLAPEVYYRIWFGARNGQWHQDLQLRRSERAHCWLAATRVMGTDGRTEVYRHVDAEFIPEFGEPAWRI